MTFRFRLAVFLVAVLVAVQALTGVLFYTVTRRALIVEGENQLAGAADVFARQLKDIGERVANSVSVLSLDYALRGAIAQRDQGTVLSALRNHGRRVGASRMLLLDLDGTILADTAGSEQAGRTFPFPDLVDSSFQRRTEALVALEGGAYLMIVVPVLAPTPIALIAAATSGGSASPGGVSCAAR